MKQKKKDLEYKSTSNSFISAGRQESFPLTELPVKRSYFNSDCEKPAHGQGKAGSTLPMGRVKQALP